jgi:hypothetical protein
MGVIEKLKHDKSLFQYLSMNLTVQKYTQTDGEALLQAISIYVGYLNDGKTTQAEAYIEECQGKGALMNVGYTMPNTEAREFAMQLYKLEGYMGHTTAFTSKWIKEHIIGVYGGVSDELQVKERTINMKWYRYYA